MKTLAIAVAALLLMFSAIHAEAIATLHVGPGYGDPCATGCGGHPNAFDGSVLDVYQTSGGAQTITNLYLILAMPDIATFSTTISSMTGYYGATAGSASAIQDMGDMTSGDVYSFLGLPGNNSPSFGNFVATATNAGDVTPTFFGIYQFNITGLTLGGNGLLDINFSTPLPHGTIALAWGDPIGRPYYETPYTEAAAVPVPEPSTLLLLGSGHVGLGGMVWRRHRKG